MKNVELTDEQVVLLNDLISADLEFFWETLKEEHGTVAEAMVAYDSTAAVQLWTKVDSESAAAHRSSTEKEVRLYLD